MEVDFNACLKSLRNSFNQYKNYLTEDTRKDLERELNVIVGLTSHGDESISNRFDPQNLLHADSLSIFASILNETKFKESVYAASMSLISELATSSKIRKSLQDKFQLTSTLLKFIMQHQTSNDQGIILQCLELLQQLTYGIKVEHSVGELDGLIKYLSSKIMSPESKLTMLCLGSLANLCRNNIVIQDYIKNMSNVKSFFKSVASFLSHPNWMNIIYALSILSISLDEPLGEKVFNQNNIDQTFVLIFNVLLKGNSAIMQKYACDLLFDLMSCSRMQVYLANYADLPARVKELIFKLKSMDEELIEKILMLLNSMSSIPDLLKAIFSDKTNEGRSNMESYMSIILDLTNKLLAKQHQTATLALKFLKNLCQVNLCGNFDASKIVDILLRNLHLVEKGKEGTLSVKGSCEIMRRSAEILAILCCENAAANYVTERVTPESISKCIEIIFTRFGAELGSTRAYTCDYRDDVSSAVVAFIELMSLLVRHTKSGQDYYIAVLQSSSLPPFLACCLSSRSGDLVKHTMKILQTTICMPSFSSDSLSTFLASNNQQREEEIALLRKNQSLHPSYHTTNLTTNGISRLLKKDGRKIKLEDNSDIMASLTERISSGLSIKDSSKISEIMDIYEHKLAFIQTKESHLQDLLDAKTEALSQADRFIAQYRCRSAQSEAECLKLRSLLLETQRTCEDQHEQIDTYMDELKILTQKADSLSEENKILGAKSHELDKLKVSYQEQLEKLTLQVKELERERKISLQNLQDLERKCAESAKSISMLKTELKEKEEEKKEDDKIIADTEKKLKQAEKAKMDLNHKVSSLGVLNNKYEKDMMKKDESIKELKQQLDKHSQIAAMIHNLSAGTIPHNGSNFNS